jgi:GDPmannose 4,6-dehydratase
MPVRVVVAGSGEVFGGNDGNPCDEQTPPSPRSPYAAAKAAAWHLVSSYRRSFGLCASTALLFNHESPLRGPDYVTGKIACAVREARLGKKLLLGDVSVVRDWGWAPDYVRALQLMALRDDPDDFVIASGESHSLAELVDLAFAQAGLRQSDYVDHDPSLLRRAEVPVIRANPSKAARVLGWKASVPFDDLVRRLVATE